MEYKRFGNTIYLRLDPKEEILEEIGKVAKKENIRLAQVTGLGAINDFTAGVYNTVTKEYHSIQFQGAFEIVSLTGTVTRKDGDVYLHLHIAAGDEKGHGHGGHLNRAIIRATAEIQIQVVVDCVRNTSTNAPREVVTVTRVACAILSVFQVYVSVTDTSTDVWSESSIGIDVVVTVQHSGLQTYTVVSTSVVSFDEVIGISSITE